MNDFHDRTGLFRHTCTQRHAPVHLPGIVGKPCFLGDAILEAFVHM